MAPIVRRSKNGDVIVVSHPTHAARALVTWATLAHGRSEHHIETMADGCVKVEIPGLTSVIYAPDPGGEI